MTKQADVNLRGISIKCGAVRDNSVSVLNILTASESQDIRTIEFTKGPNDSLGISIAGGVGSPLGDIPIFIAMMNPVGLAAQTQLKVKDPPTIEYLAFNKV